jgi:hypothetical protein
MSRDPLNGLQARLMWKLATAFLDEPSRSDWAMHEAPGSAHRDAARDSARKSSTQRPPPHRR